MTKIHKSNKLINTECNKLNPVAKNAFKFNKALVFRDQSRYSRKAKHKLSEPFKIIFTDIILKGSDLNGFNH